MCLVRLMVLVSSSPTSAFPSSEALAGSAGIRAHDRGLEAAACMPASTQGTSDPVRSCSRAEGAMNVAVETYRQRAGMWGLHDPRRRGAVRRRHRLSRPGCCGQGRCAASPQAADHGSAAAPQRSATNHPMTTKNMSDEAAKR